MNISNSKIVQGAVFLLALLLTACGGGATGGGGNAPGNPAPTVSATSPANNATDVAAITATPSTGVRVAAGNAMASNSTRSLTTQAALPGNARIVFLHHSTGSTIYWGGIGANVGQILDAYNSANGTNYLLDHPEYPSTSGGYPWENYPYDYWNLWVNHTGTSMDRGELNLDMLAAQYDVIVFKHCFPASTIEPDTGVASVSSPTKSLENYKLQYAALKARMLQFPDKKFIVWTAAARRADDVAGRWNDPTGAQRAADALRAKEFSDWVITTWDKPGDNIYVWNFFSLETGGNANGYLLDANSYGPGNSHPNNAFATVVAPYFVQRMIDVIEGRGDSGSITGDGNTPDTTPPTVSSTNPANNSTGIATNAAITATFSESMTASTVSNATFTLNNGVTGNDVTGTVNYSGTTATFTPTSALANGTTYTATISTAVKDLAGNAMTNARTWTFTTVTTADTTPPTVSSTSPVNNATGIATNAAITATFSEAMTASTVNNATFTLMNGTTSVAGSVTYSGTTATFTPTSALANSTTYTATISTDVKDAAGNAMTSARTWTFTTQAAPAPSTARIVFLHHSTGSTIYWGGAGANIGQRLDAYNSANGTNYQLDHPEYPSTNGGYPWENYPYDYWNLWVNHTGTSMDRGELNLDMLAAQYDVIVFKHCFPASTIDPDTGVASVSSPTKSLENYKLQYAALKARMLQFPDKKFIVWTAAARRADDVAGRWNDPTGAQRAADALRAKEFSDWVKTTWDVPGDNIYVWDFFNLETGGNANGYLLDANSYGPGNSHPNNAFATVVAPYFVQRMIDVIEGRGDSGSITGH